MPKMNYRYFRHRLDASDDPKLQSLVDDMGIVALGYYYSLLEIYGKHYDDKKENSAVLIHRRVIANTWRKRVDSCDKVLTKLQLSDLLVYTKCKNTYSIDIPNFPKYYGYYGSKTLDKSSKESKVKESKVKESKEVEKKENYSEKLTQLVSDNEVVIWLKNNGSQKIQDELYEKYNHDVLAEEIENAYYWQKENNKKRMATTFLRGWMDRCNASDKVSQKYIDKKIYDQLMKLGGDGMELQNGQGEN
jgi:hypothetical protein